MILANVRGRLRASDLRLVLLAFSRQGRHYDRLLAEEGPDRLLDEPGLLDALLALRCGRPASPTAIWPTIWRPSCWSSATTIGMLGSARMTIKPIAISWTS